MVSNCINKNDLVVFLMLMLQVIGCATPDVATVRYFKLINNTYEGTLLGDQPAHDLSFKAACGPKDTSDDSDGKCVIIKTTDFFDYKRACSEAKQASGLYPPELDTH